MIDSGTDSGISEVGDGYLRRFSGFLCSNKIAGSVFYCGSHSIDIGRYGLAGGPGGRENENESTRARDISESSGRRQREEQEQQQEQQNNRRGQEQEQ